MAEEKVTGKEFLPTQIDIFDHSLPNEAKDTNEYGKAWAKHIEQEWDLGYSQGNFAQRKSNMQEIRSHMIGQVNLEKYKPMFGVDAKDESYMALNWKFPSIVSKYVNLVSDGIEDDIFSPKIEAVDGHSLQEKDTVKKALRNKMYGAKLKQEFAKNFGGQFAEQNGYVPESEDEINVYMDNFRSASEVASEIAVNKFMQINNTEEINNRIKKDLAAYRIGVVSIDKDSNKGIKINRVDPVNFIMSADLENSNDKRGCYYYGQIEKKTIGDIRSESNGELTEDDLKRIASGYSTHNVTPSTDIDDVVVEVLYFTFKTTNKSVYKKKYNSYGGSKMIKKPSYWKPKKLHNFEVVEAEYDVWYSGHYIIGGDAIYGYGVNPNVARDPENIGIAYSPFIVYELDSESIAERIIPYAENIYTIYIKIQQLILSARPKGYAINIDALQNIDLGDAGSLDPIRQIEIYDQSGKIIYSGENIVGDPEQIPIHETPGGISGDLQQLVMAYNHYLEQVESVSGINKIRDGSTPSAKAAVGVQQLALAASNNATKYIYNGFMSIYKNTSATLLRFVQSFLQDPKIGNKIVSAIGQKNSDVLEELQDLENRSFITNVNVAMSQEEKQNLAQDVQIAIKSGQIDITDKIDIMEAENIKYANLLLKARKKLRAKKMQKQQLAKEKRERQAEQMKMRQEMQKQQAEKQMQFKLDQAAADRQVQRDIRKEEMENKLYKIKRKIDAYYKMKEILAESQGDMQQVKYKEDRTDERANMQDTNESELIEQRQNDTGSKEFPKNRNPY